MLLKSCEASNSVVMLQCKHSVGMKKFVYCRHQTHKHSVHTKKSSENIPLTHKLTLSYTRAKLTSVYHTIHCYSLSVEIGVFFSIFLKGRKTKSKFSKKSSSSSSFTCYGNPPPAASFLLHFFRCIAMAKLQTPKNANITDDTTEQRPERLDYA